MPSVAAWTAPKSQLVRSEKLTALTRLVAGIAHEMNTSIGIGLTVASTLQDTTQVILKEISEGQLRKSSLENYLSRTAKGTELLLSALNTAGELVSNFKQLAVDQTSSRRRPFELQRLLEDIALSLSPLIAPPFLLELDLQTGVRLDSYPGSIGQVINNLFANAILHGFEDRQKGTIRLVSKLVNDETIEIIFEDDGVGISTDNLLKVFDPFFTTRLGRGSRGLGLSIVHNIVTLVLGGRIAIESSLGIGTRFFLHIPITAPSWDT